MLAFLRSEITLPIPKREPEASVGLTSYALTEESMIYYISYTIDIYILYILKS